MQLPAVTKKKRWLILTHAFNMDGRASSQTITDKMPYLLADGVKPTVFSAITGIKDQRFPHRQFLAWGPAAFRFDFRHWIANQYGRGFIYKLLTRIVSILLAPFIGLEKLILGYSSQWSWAMPAFMHGYKLIRDGQIDLVYSTGGAWSAHLAGLWLKKVTGVKWIAEIHDPLVIRKSPVDEGSEKPKNRDARFRHYLEKQIIRYADFAWWFTDGAVHYAKARNPNLNTAGNARGFMVLPGAEPPGGLSSAKAHIYSDTLNLSHSGSLAKDRSLSTILRALHSLFQKYPQAREKIRVHAYGAALDELTLEAVKQFCKERREFHAIHGTDNPVFAGTFHAMQLPKCFAHEISSKWFNNRPWELIKQDKKDKILFYAIVNEYYSDFVCHPSGKIPLPYNPAIPTK